MPDLSVPMEPGLAQPPAPLWLVRSPRLHQFVFYELPPADTDEPARPPLQPTASEPCSSSSSSTPPARSPSLPSLSTRTPSVSSSFTADHHEHASLHVTSIGPKRAPPQLQGGLSGHRQDASARMVLHRRRIMPPHLQIDLPCLLHAGGWMLEVARSTELYPWP